MSLNLNNNNSQIAFGSRNTQIINRILTGDKKVDLQPAIESMRIATGGTIEQSQRLVKSCLNRIAKQADQQGVELDPTAVRAALLDTLPKHVGIGKSPLTSLQSNLYKVEANGQESTKINGEIPNLAKTRVDNRIVVMETEVGLFDAKSAATQRGSSLGNATRKLVETNNGIAENKRQLELQKSILDSAFINRYKAALKAAKLSEENVATLRAARKALNVEIAALEKRYNYLESEISRYRSSEQTLTTELRAKNAELISAKSTLEDLRAQVAEINKKLITLFDD